MSNLTHKDLRPFGTTNATKLISHIKRGRSSQGAAATVASPAGLVANMDPVDQDMTITDITFVASVTPAAGESLVIDVTVDGTTILSGTFTFNNTLVGDRVYSLKNLLLAASNRIRAGQIVRVIRTYTAGGGPAMGAATANAVVIEAAPIAYG